MDPATGIAGGYKAGPFAFATGGIVTKPTFALVGEAGPEAIVPLGQGGTLMPGGNIVRQHLVKLVQPGGWP